MVHILFFAHFRLIAPICLWLDLYDKMLKLVDSKDKVEKVVVSYERFEKSDVKELWISLLFF